jgi:NAD(P)-dependent dehydrogenase (short-subunit alcohol dehydrogenase family)
MTSMEIKGTVIVTGANGGLGSAFVERLLQSKPSNQYGIFTVRGLTDQSSGTLEKLLSSSSFPHSIVPLDLTSLSAVREFAEDVNSRVTTVQIPQIRAVVLNAAWQTFDGKIHYTKDGIETTFAVDYLSNFLLVLLLLKSMDPEKGRIVFVSSFTHDTSHYMNSAFVSEKLIYRDPELIAHPDCEDKKGEEWVQGMRRYALSKMLLIMFMYKSFVNLD